MADRPSLAGRWIPIVIVVTACGDATPEPTANASLRAITSPSADLVWTEASLEKDWPAPLRQEPLLGTEAVPLPHADAVGDTAPGSVPWIDIERVRLSELSPPPGGTVSVNLAGRLPAPVPQPGDSWIAYGLVLDTDGDGAGDVRLGIDNMPHVGEPPHRAWRTDLQTGDTASKAGEPYGLVDGMYLDTWFPGEGFFRDEGKNVATFLVALRHDEPQFRFYAWASVIEDGSVVATDYAPDAGWFDATTAANE